MPSAEGAGKRYLIQHSAGSGKSNSIAWLAHQLIALARNGDTVFDSIIVVTDRLILDKQITATIRQFAQIGATIGHAKDSGDLQPFHRIGQENHHLHGAEISAHSRRNRQRATRTELRHHHRRGPFQPGRKDQQGDGASAVGSGLRRKKSETFEDRINRIMESHKLLPNAAISPSPPRPRTRHSKYSVRATRSPTAKSSTCAFHSYTMKQAIQEGFILDVLAQYTPVSSYYKLAKTIEDDPEFDANKARKKLRRFVEGHDHAIRLKAEIMVDHFHEKVLAQRKIGGEARAMVVTNGIERAIQYFHAFRDYLKERKSRYQAIVAFSGEHEFGGEKVSEASLNGFPSRLIAEKIQEDPYRFLICADKFQTGYDEPLLHTMYVDKTLSGIKAVQTLSRLNRSHPGKHDVFVLDFLNDADTIREAFAPFYRTTILAAETDPNKLHDLQADLDGAQVYSPDQVEEFTRRYLDEAPRDQLDPILDACVEVYLRELDEDGQVDFKGKAKGFVRTYNFLSTVLPWNNPAWEMRSIFLNFLIPKLPAPKEEDLSKGILDAIDMESYRVEKQAMQKIMLSDEDGEIDPVPTGAEGYRPEPELDRLTNIINEFNDRFGGIEWEDSDRVMEMITKTIPRARCGGRSLPKRPAAFSDKENTRIELDRALLRVMTSIMNDDNQLFKQFMDNDSFKHWMTAKVFESTSSQARPALKCESGLSSHDESSAS